MRGMWSVLAALMVVLGAAAAPAADWPTKPVRVLVPYGAGGAADTMGRVFADSIGTAIGQAFYVENRPGGGGMAGTDAASKAAPDGYTFVLAGMSTLVLVPAMNKNAGFDPVRDFTHVAYFGGAPNIFVVHPSSGITSFQDFMTRAKSGATIEYVSPGVGSVGNLVAEFLAAKEGLKMVHVAYRGGAGALLDLVAGHVKVGMMSLSTAGEHVRARQSGADRGVVGGAAEGVAQRADPEGAGLSGYRRHHLVGAGGARRPAGRHHRQGEWRGRQEPGAAAGAQAARTGFGAGQGDEPGRDDAVRAQRSGKVGAVRAPHAGRELTRQATQHSLVIPGTVHRARQRRWTGARNP